jgi:hypothetical protein
MLILDFVGVSANLDLISHESFLDDASGVDSSTPTDEPASSQKSEDSVEPTEDDEPGFFEAGNLNLAAMAKGIRSQTVHSYDDFDPFEASGVSAAAVSLKGSEIGKELPISHKQYRLLCRFGIDDETLSKAEAQKLVGFCAEKKFRLWAPQLSVLKKLHADIVAARDEEGFV